jgi:hypothetical protein
MYLGVEGSTTPDWTLHTPKQTQNKKEEYNVKPLSGVIVKKNEENMEVYLESGNTVTVSSIAEMKRGDSISVAIDYTRLLARAIPTENTIST